MSNRGGVDYSKWDKMANDMSDSEDEDTFGNKPEVTTFDEPQSVTFGGTAASQAADDWGDCTRSTRSPPGPATSELVGTRTTAAKSVTRQCTPVTDDQLAENGDAVYAESEQDKDATNAARIRYIWRQTRAEVAVVIPAPPGVRACDVNVTVTAKSGTITEGVAELIRVTIKAEEHRKAQETSGAANGIEAEGSLVLLDGELPFQTTLEDEIDWELKDFPDTRVSDSYSCGESSSMKSTTGGAAGVDAGEAAQAGVGEHRPRCRGIEITLRKHCPIPNAVVWWRSFLKGDPEIDVSSIQGRAKNKGHQSAWEEALGMFKAKMADRKARGKIEVDTGED